MILWEARVYKKLLKSGFLSIEMAADVYAWGMSEGNDYPQSSVHM